jgi:hypothetical protein
MPETATKKAPATPVAITKDQLKAATDKAQKAVDSQPKRAEGELSKDAKEKAFNLGKSIAADLWRLKHAQAGKTSAKTVESMVARVIANVEARNSIRKAKKAS